MTSHTLQGVSNVCAHSNLSAISHWWTMNPKIIRTIFCYNRIHSPGLSSRFRIMAAGICFYSAIMALVRLDTDVGWWGEADSRCPNSSQRFWTVLRPGQAPVKFFHSKTLYGPCFVSGEGLAQTWDTMLKAHTVYLFSMEIGQCYGSVTY